MEELPSNISVIWKKFRFVRTKYDDMKAGDLVTSVQLDFPPVEGDSVALVLETGISMFGDETCPLAAKVLWTHIGGSGGHEIEVVYEDELRVISEAASL